ncbi:uncharacterized protein L201_006175 [Kwoniella dendrophila CBS 6074]|uniref:Uncharacterized protein n=1 Tax=Kwoniella dendrophila CBS 6074 TaxID=1295534 RepID=A0AAX4K2A9_9TREE
MFNTRLRKRRRDQIQGNAEFDYEEWLRKPKKVKSDDIVDMNMGYPQRYYIGHHHASVDFPISSERRSFSSSSSDEETPEKHVTSQSSTFSSSSTLTNSPSSRKYQKNESSHSSKTSHRSPSGSSVPSSPIQQNSNRFRRRELRRSSSLHDLYSNIYIDEDHMVNEDEYHGEVILGKSVYPLSSRLRNHAKPTNLSRVKGRPFHPDLEILSQATNTPSKSNDAFRQYTISSASSGTHSTLITPQQSLSRNAFQDVIMPENHDDMFR